MLKDLSHKILVVLWGFGRSLPKNFPARRNHHDEVLSICFPLKKLKNFRMTIYGVKEDCPRIRSLTLNYGIGLFFNFPLRSEVGCYQKIVFLWVVFFFLGLGKTFISYIISYIGN